MMKSILFLICTLAALGLEIRAEVIERTELLSFGTAIGKLDASLLHSHPETRFPSAGRCAAERGQDPEDRIELFWVDYRLLANKLPSWGRKAVETEVQSIYREAGVEVSFHGGSADGTFPTTNPSIRIGLMPRVSGLKEDP